VADCERLSKNDAVTHYIRGNLLRSQRKLDEAVAAYRKAIAIDPGYAEAHCNLGHTLRDRRQYAESLAAMKKGHELGSKRQGWRYPSDKWVAACGRLVQLDARLPAILKGREKPKDAMEQSEFASFCVQKGLPAAAARLYREVVTARPELTGLRFPAACAAALAGCGAGDAAQLDDKERARWRAEALGWLRADVKMWRKALENKLPRTRKVAQGALEFWKGNTDLAGLREAAALARLPAAEREAWQKLWAEVEGLLQQARQGQQPK
jgi:tetratricopeptide (TPR) repeat protein